MSTGNLVKCRLNNKSVSQKIDEYFKENSEGRFYVYTQCSKLYISKAIVDFESFRIGANFHGNCIAVAIKHV